LTEYDSFVGGRLPGLRRSAYLLCGDWDRGDDLVQKVLTELYVKWARARRADNLDALVRTMLVRRFLDDRRTGWTRRVRLTDERVETPAPAEPEPADRLDVLAALSRLPARQRAVVVLRFLHDMSVDQTAEALRCAPGTVKSQTSRALASLRSLLGVSTERGRP